MKKLWPYFFGLFLLLPGKTFAQEKELGNDVIQQRIEFIAAQFESGTIDYSNLIETLLWYYSHPLNLNSATESELNSLGFLTPFQVNALITYRIKYGALQTVYELRNIEGFDFLTIQNLLPFVKTVPVYDTEKFSFRKAFKYGRNEVISLYSRVLETQQGYLPADSNSSPNSRYLGDPNRLYLRYRYRWGNKLSIGFTAEKDPGEEFFKGINPYGFDFYSAHLFMANVGPAKQIAVGDFHAQFGQGLTFWSGFAYQKTTDALNVLKFGQKLRPYTSRNENNFLRGAGATFALGKKLELTAFYSNKRIDANIAPVDSINDPLGRAFTSLQTSGLHRTPSEAADKHAIREEIAGANLAFKTRYFKIGLRGIRSKYDGDFNRDKQLYQKFQLDTNLWYNVGLDFQALVKNFSFFGEAAYSNNGGWAYLAGVLVRLTSRLKITVINRNFQKDYLVVYSNAFGERSTNNNERGTYLGLEATLASRLVLTAYVDHYAFDWLKYQTDGPSEGTDFMGRLSWKPTRNLDVYFRVRHEIQERNSAEDEVIHTLVKEKKTYWRTQLDYRLSSRLSMRSRVEISAYKLGDVAPSKGFLMYQDFRFDFMQYRSRLVGRVAFFDIDNYNARIYTYENDVLYYFSVPAYADRGWRAYLMWQFKITKGIETWVRVSRTFLSNQSSFGSSTELIDAPHRTDVRVQVRFKF